MPDFLDILGALGQGASAGLQAHDSLQQREREQKIEDAERQRQKAMDALVMERMLLENRQLGSPQERFNVEDGRVVPEGGYTDRSEAEQAAEAMRAYQRRDEVADRNRQVTQAERVAEATARGRARGAGPSVTDDVGTIPPGYRAVRDASGRVTALEPIAGGPVARDIQGEVGQGEAKSAVTIRAAETVVEDVGRALDLIKEYGQTAVGVGGLTRRIPATRAHAVSQLIESIKGNIGIDTLLKIKESGSGLGQVPQAQLEMLASVLGRLDPTMRPEDLTFNLERIRDIYSDIIMRAGGDVTSGVGAAPVDGTSGSDWQARARELRSQGMSPQEVALTLRREGWIR